MATDALTPERVVSSNWDELLARFDTLAEAPLTRSTLDGWLADWSATEAPIWEATARAAIASASNTEDADAQALHLRLSGQIGPRVDEQHARLAVRLLALDHVPPDLEPMVQQARDQQATIRPEQASIRERLTALAAQYEQVAGGMTAEWDGEQTPLPQLATHLQDLDRGVRECAVRKLYDGFVARRDELPDLFDAQYHLRQELAQTAGFSNYRDFVFREKSRPYGPAAVEALHRTIERTVVPALARRYQRRREGLGLKALAPWDTEVDLSGGAPLRPAQTSEELVAGAERIFGQIHPDFGRSFALMRADGCLDLESRVGKAPGGFCISLDVSKRPFILANMMKSHDDVRVMTHEGGHAMHAFAVYERQPLNLLRFPGAEMCEMVAMAIELLGARYLSRENGGFYEGGDSRRAQIKQLEDILSLLAYIAKIDAFQTWIYTSGQGHDRGARDAAWVEICRRFDPGIDWSAYPEGLVARWYQQSLIFVAPLYMIEYAIAQVGALQIWQRSLADQDEAVEALRRAMAFGNTRLLPELFEMAGIPFAFDSATVSKLVGVVESQLAELERIDQEHHQSREVSGGTSGCQ